MSDNIYYSKGEITDSDRMKVTGHRGGVFWFFGLSGSGKSAISRAVEAKLISNGINAFRLDGDNLRGGLNSDLGFSKEDRKENIRRAAETARLLAEAGVVVLATFITPLNENRKAARDIIGELYHGIYVRCSVATCRSRDPKGLYERALNGEISDFTGVSAPFETPDDDSYIIDTEKNDEETCFEDATEYIMKKIK